MVSDGPIVRVIRYRLIAFATALLISQVAAMAAAPVALYNTKAAADGSALLCECKVEPGAQCPMHGGKAHEEEKARGRRAGHLSPGCDSDATAILTLLAGGTGIAQASSDIVRPATTAVAVAALTSAVLDTNQPPASPPPRV